MSHSLFFRLFFTTTLYNRRFQLSWAQTSAPALHLLSSVSCADDYANFNVLRFCLFVIRESSSAHMFTTPSSCNSPHSLQRWARPEIATNTAARSPPQRCTTVCGAIAPCVDYLDSLHSAHANLTIDMQLRFNSVQFLDSDNFPSDRSDDEPLVSHGHVGRRVARRFGFC
jgi:hypothetical protein